MVNLNRTAFWAGALWLSAVSAWPAIGHAAAANEQGDDPLLIEEVVVTGLRGSVEKGLRIKRASTNFVDAISAEDIGKLPDANIAEALQRVTGVAIRRNRGEGDFVSIRGLGSDFVRGVVNGRTLLSATEYRDPTRSGGVDNSTGRGINFDVLPSEIVNVIEVVKSPSAEHVEGGMGGVVNILTPRPLAVGRAVSGSLKGTYRTFNEDFDPSVSGLYSWANEDNTFGWLASASYSKRSIRDDSSDGWGYAPIAWGPLGTVDADGDGTADDFPNARMATSAIMQSHDEQRERATLQGTFQWAFGDERQQFLTADFLYSQRDVDSLGALATLDGCCGWISGAELFELVNVGRNADGSARTGVRVDDDGTPSSFSLVSALNSGTDLQDIDDELLSIGVNYELALFDDWSLNLDASYSKAEGELDFQRVSLTTLSASQYDLRLSDQLELTPSGGAGLPGDISGYRTHNADSVERYNDDEELAFALDASRAFEGNGFAGALKFGSRYRVRNKDKDDRTTFNTNTFQTPVVGGAIATFQVSDFLDGDSPFPFGDVFFSDIDSHRAFVSSRDPGAVFAAVPNPSNSYGIEEKTLAGYVQLDLDGALGSLPFSGNVGLRVVRTDADSTGFFRPFRVENDEEKSNLGSIVFTGPDVTSEVFSNKYMNVLPSLNLRFELREDVVLRFSANKSVTRPTFENLSPGLDIFNPTNRLARSGNPDLQAYEAANYDLGLEWYFADGGAVYVGGFAKTIDDFIASGTTIDTSVNANSDGDGDGVPDGLGSSVERFGVGFASIQQPDNQGDAEIVGLEAGYQHIFNNGFGYVLNATLADSSAEYTSGSRAGEDLLFPGVSDLSYNLTGFYENDKLEARIAYSFRTDFVILTSDFAGNQLYADDYGQLDVSLSYRIKEKYVLFFNVLNLTGTDAKVFSETKNRPIALSTVGTRLEFGVRARF